MRGVLLKYILFRIFLNFDIQYSYINYFDTQFGLNIFWIFSKYFYHLKSVTAYLTLPYFQLIRNMKICICMRERESRLVICSLWGFVSW